MINYNIHTLLNRLEENFKDRGYIYEKHSGRYIEKTCSQFAQDVRRFACCLLAKGYHGTKIMLYGANSYNYMVADIAIMGYVGTCVTPSKEWKAYDLCNAIRQTDTKAVIYSDEKEQEISSVKAICSDTEFIPFEKALNFCTETQVTLIPFDANQCAKILFSSGTTGTPKAVMLSQKNMFANWESLYRRTPFNHWDICYLFLPLSHTYGGLCNFLYSLISGMKIYLCSDTRKIFDEMQEVKPTFFCAVPLIYERLYDLCKSSARLPEDVLGGNIKYLFSGGAYLQEEIRRYIKSRGINLIEAYGLSETSSIISVEYSNNTDFTSVGTVLENIEIKIDNLNSNECGEILVRGENVFSGYYNIDNSRVFDKDGYFRTGDLGIIKDNKLYLQGRAKRIILLSNGENVFPDDLEAMFADYEQISKAKIYEKDGKIFACLYMREPDLAAADTIVSSINDKLPKFARIQAFETIPDNIESRMK